jgi:hypothetical protein
MADLVTAVCTDDVCITPGFAPCDGDHKVL